MSPSEQPPIADVIPRHKEGFWDNLVRYGLPLLVSFVVALSGWAMWLQQRITRYDPVRIEIHREQLEAYRNLASALHTVTITAQRYTEGDPIFRKDLNSVFEPLSDQLGRDNILIDKDTGGKIQDLIDHCSCLVNPCLDSDFQTAKEELIRLYNVCIQAMRRALGTDRSPIDLGRS